MASSRTLISSQTLGTAAASVTFSSIPSTYTDLVLKASIRTNRASEFDAVRLEINSDSSALYSTTTLYGAGSVGSGSGANSSYSYILNGQQNGDNSVANTFSNFELYIPSYTASQSKPLSSFSGTEDNNTYAWIYSIAGLYRSNTAISGLKLTSNTGNNFVAGSSFYLYGLKAS